VVSTDGAGVVSHAGTALLSEVADRFGLTAAFAEATDGLRRRRSGHDPGRVLVDVAVAIADGAETISDVQALADQPDLHGPVASTATIWRVLEGVDAGVLGRLRTARATARERAWAARAELTGAELPPAPPSHNPPSAPPLQRSTERPGLGVWDTLAHRAASHSWYNSTGQASATPVCSMAIRRPAASWSVLERRTVTTRPWSLTSTSSTSRPASSLRRRAP